VVVVTDDRLPISEIFGPTIQGEGPAAGQCATFVRFMGCNLSCSWCDTAYTWDGDRFGLRVTTNWWTPTQILTEVANRSDTGIVVVTGGEPLLRQDHPAWSELLAGLMDGGWRLHIETNGTLVPTAETLAAAELICVSPKLANAGEHRGHQNPTPRAEFVDLAHAHQCLHLKVVCQDEGDVERAARMALALRWPWGRVWVMPEGTTTEVLNRRWPVIASAAARLGINATHRLHVLAWGDERGH
jgi:7-carboxy-7-deazaguanine synthase